jgi:glycosyltransferase involved in cell wall biosynthesis
VLRSLDVGGAEKQILLLIKNIHQTSHACNVFTLETVGILNQQLSKLNVPVYSGGVKKGEIHQSPGKMIFAALRLLVCIRSVRPKIIHSVLPLVTFMGTMLGRIFKVSLIVTSRRALTSHQYRYPFLKLFDCIANHMSHVVTVNSMAVMRDVLMREYIDPSRVVLIYNGVETSQFNSVLNERDEIRRALGIQPTQKVVICVANLIPYKGHSTLVRAARIVIDKNANTKFLIVGEDRGIKKNLERAVQCFGLENKIRFLGLRQDIPQLLTASDLSVLPSHEEGFSNVLLESMAAGRAIVTTNVGGNPEAVVHGETGWLVPPGQPVLMAEKIMDLLRESNKADLWGKRGKDRVVKHFSHQKMIDKHLALYQRVV